MDFFLQLANMDPNLASIIGAVLGAILAALVGWALTYFLNYEAHPYYQKISREMMNDLKGTWSGNFQQELKNEAIDVRLILTLTISRTGKIKGEIKYKFGNINYKIIVRGGFYSTDFLKLEYVNPAHPSRQFGSFVLDYDGIFKSLSGRFVGHGNINRDIISGSIKLNKTLADTNYSNNEVQTILTNQLPAIEDRQVSSS